MRYARRSISGQAHRFRPVIETLDSLLMVGGLTSLEIPQTDQTTDVLVEQVSWMSSPSGMPTEAEVSMCGDARYKNVTPTRGAALEDKEVTIARHEWRLFSGFDRHADSSPESFEGWLSEPSLSAPEHESTVQLLALRRMVHASRYGPVDGTNDAESHNHYPQSPRETPTRPVSVRSADVVGGNVDLIATILGARKLSPPILDTEDCDRIVAIPWNPTAEELLPEAYPYSLIGVRDPLVMTHADALQNIYMAPPEHPVAYRFGEDPTLGQEYDYFGYIQSECNPYVSFLWFYNPGVYVVKFDYATQPDTIQFFYADAAPGHRGPLKNSENRRINTPSASPGAFIIEDPDPANDNGYISNAVTVVPTAKRASSVAAAIGFVNQAYADNGNQAVDVVLVGHGNSSQISVGAGQSVAPTKQLVDNDADVQTFVTALQGKISSIYLVGCYIGQDLDTKPNHLMKSLLNGLRTPQQTVVVYAYDQEVSATQPGWFRAGYFSVDVHGVQVSVAG